MDVTRFQTCLKAELSRVMLDLSAEEEDQKTAKTRKGSSSSPSSSSSSSSSSSHRQRQLTALFIGVEYSTEIIELAQAGSTSWGSSHSRSTCCTS